MKKLCVVLGMSVCFLFTGCAAVVQLPAALAADSAKSHPAIQSFSNSAGKNETFNVVMRTFGASGRKLTSSDREAGIVQGEIDDYAVAVKITGKQANSSVEITVTYNKPFIYGVSKAEKISADLKNDILSAPVVSAKTAHLANNKKGAAHDTEKTGR